ncbi:MAG: AarF/ABC1/UbiB kinase family protein [Myxococcales bacterium]|nr:AarF/ABC1/UbiB kinase family protein [Myxococcales bacterium]
MVHRWFVFWLIVYKHLFIRFFQLVGLRWLFWKIAHSNEPYERINGPIFLRRVFEDLGPTYIKLGQLIASSPGLFPEAYAKEFQKCLDRVPPISTETAKSIIAQGLGKPYTEIFATFEDEPIAAASIAQVHGATLADGSDVVVKIQRPQIHDRVVADVAIMRRAASIGQRFSKQLQLSNAVGIIDDFHRTILEELDFRKEGRNMDEFNEIVHTHGMAELVAPKVYWDYTGELVLTMERFHGFKADDVEKIREFGIDSEKYLRTGLRGWMLTVMLYGFFHGDVHAGNLMFLPDTKRIGFLDFGIIGRFTDEQRMQVLKYILLFVTQDWEGLAHQMVEMGSAPKDVPIKEFAAGMAKTYEPLMSKSLADIKYQEVLPNITRYALKYGVRIPNEFILILKQLLYFDRYAKLTAPKLNVFSDLYLVDFLFTPEAMKRGMDMNQIMPILQRIQQLQAQQSAAASAG